MKHLFKVLGENEGSILPLLLGLCMGLMLCKCTDKISDTIVKIEMIKAK